MLGKIVGDKLKDSKLQSARSSLDQFNTYMSQAAKYAVPETEHDIEHSKVSILSCSCRLRRDKQGS